MNSHLQIQTVGRIEIGRVVKHAATEEDQREFFTRDIRIVGIDGAATTMTAFAPSRAHLSLHMLAANHLGAWTEDADSEVVQETGVES